MSYSELHPHPPLQRTSTSPMLVRSGAQPRRGDNNELLVLSNNSIGFPFGVCQDNYSPTGNTDAEDHLRYGARAGWDSLLHGSPGHQEDVGARTKERRPRKHATAQTVFKRGVLCGGGRHGVFCRLVCGSSSGDSSRNTGVPRPRGPHF